MKIKTLLQAPEILQKAKELNIDLTTLDAQTRVKLKDGCLHFEGEKECFVSAKIGYNVSESIGHTQGEYYYFRENETFIIRLEDQYLDYIWHDFNNIDIGKYCTPDKTNVYRRKIQKNPTS
jgi:hypothetical protein